MTRRGVFLNAAAIDVFNNGKKSTVEKKGKGFYKKLKDLKAYDDYVDKKDFFYRIKNTLVPFFI